MSNELTKLIDTIAMLRHPTKGCPWDLEQDHQSLLRYLIEEAYEYIHAVNTHNKKEMEEELGDVLLQVLLHAQIASEDKSFDIYSVAKKLNDKMIRRHPHVFDKPDPDISLDELHERWDKIKKTEKQDTPNSSFTDKDLSAPPLLAAFNIGKKTNKLEFDWNDASEVMKKVQEELQELQVEIKNNNTNKSKEEMGDFIFTIAQLARHLNMDPHECLIMANAKFVKRFTCLEKFAKPGKVNDLSREEKENLWDKVKINEKS